MNKPIICGFSALLWAGLALAQDPTQPEWSAPVAADSPQHVAAQPVLRLQLIRQQGAQQLAVINGQSLKVGQSIAGYRLVKISRDQVTLRNEQAQVVLPLFVTTRR